MSSPFGLLQKDGDRCLIDYPKKLNCAAGVGHGTTGFTTKERCVNENVRVQWRVWNAAWNGVTARAGIVPCPERHRRAIPRGKFLWGQTRQHQPPCAVGP